MKTVSKMTTISKLFPACFVLTAALLVTAGCNHSKTPPADNSTAATSQSAVPGQTPVSITPSANEGAEPAHSWTTDQILTCTVSQCWHLANKKEDDFFDIVQQLAAISARNRDITLPDDQAAGEKVGQIIKDKAKADHDQLLFAVVDDAVRQVGKPAPEK